MEWLASKNLMSNTPRTDTAAFDKGCDGRDRHANGEYVESDFARKLERENNALREALIPFAQIGDIANDADCTLWKRAVAAGDVRRARNLILANTKAEPRAQRE